MIHEFAHGFENLPADAGVPLHESICSHEHGGFGVTYGKEVFSDDAGVEKSYKLGLQVGHLLRASVRGGTEAGGDAVGVGAPCHVVGDPRGAPVDAIARRRGVESNNDGRTTSDGGDLRDSQRGALKVNCIAGLELGDHSSNFFEVGALESFCRLLPVGGFGDVGVAGEEDRVYAVPWEGERGRAERGLWMGKAIPLRRHWFLVDGFWTSC